MIVPVQTATISAVPRAHVDSFHETFAYMEDTRLYNKLVDQDTTTLGTKSTQLPHPSVPSHNNHNVHGGQSDHDGHRVWRSSTIGYIAPNFEGKRAQMAEGQYTRTIR
jgi:hypothetical protein